MRVIAFATDVFDGILLEPTRRERFSRLYTNIYIHATARSIGNSGTRVYAIHTSDIYARSMRTTCMLHDARAIPLSVMSSSSSYSNKTASFDADLTVFIIYIYFIYVITYTTR